MLFSRFRLGKLSLQNGGDNYFVRRCSAVEDRHLNDTKLVGGPWIYRRPALHQKKKANEFDLTAKYEEALRGITGAMSNENPMPIGNLHRFGSVDLLCHCDIPFL